MRALAFLALAFLALALAGLSACAAPGPSALVERSARIVTGFREASAEVAELLDAAAAWAVFPAVEDVRDGCRHEGVLFEAGGAVRPALLRCRSGPDAPGGVSYHQLVLLLDATTLERLPLDLARAPHGTVDQGLPPGAREAPVVVVSSRWGSLLFPRGPLDQGLELE